MYVCPHGAPTDLPSSNWMTRAPWPHLDIWETGKFWAIICLVRKSEVLPQKKLEAEIEG